MELFFAPFACSLAAHILCREANIPVTLRKVDLRRKTVDGGGKFLEITPKGQVPALRLADGAVLTEGMAVLHYLADLKHESGLMPPARTSDYYRCLEWLSYVSSELHKRIFYMMFWPGNATVAADAKAAAPARLAFLEETLADTDYLLGERFTAADAYLFWWLSLAPQAGIEVTPYPRLLAYTERCAVRPGVSRAVNIERALQAK